MIIIIIIIIITVILVKLGAARLHLGVRLDLPQTRYY